jgi:hypothetical protein
MNRYLSLVVVPQIRLATSKSSLLEIGERKILLCEGKRETMSAECAQVRTNIATALIFVPLIILVSALLLLVVLGKVTFAKGNP